MIRLRDSVEEDNNGLRYSEASEQMEPEFYLKKFE